MIRTSEQGNALFYVLIAVSLLAALSYAVVQSSRGNVAQINTERARLLAAEIIEYSDTMANAVAQLRLRGTDLDLMCFDHVSWGASDYDHAGCTDNLNKIYHVSGGGLTWTQAPSDAMDAAATPDNLWHIYGDNEVQDIGTTCAAAGCSDLLLITDELTQDVCIQINRLLGVTNPSSVPPTDTDIGETRYIGAFGYSQTIGDEAGGSVLAGQNAGCFENTTDGVYLFYKVLTAR